MEVIQKSRKRNHTSPPAPSTFTRSKAQNLLHRSRSGKIRPDPIRSKAEPYSVPAPTQEELYHVPVHFAGNNASKEFSESEYKTLIQDICKEYCESDSEDKDLVKDLCKKAKLDDGDLACATAKDLRTRRVYSFLSSAGACSDLIESALSNGSAVGSDLEAAELGFESPFGDNGDAGVVDGRISLTEVPVLGLSCEPRGFNRGNTESSYESPKLQVHKQIDERSGGYCLDKIDDLGEEPVQTTPPDAVISINLEVNGDARKTEDILCVNGTLLTVNADENSGKSFSGTKDFQLNSHVLNSKSVLKPRLPGKLFKAPGSVNYKRLMEIMGDDLGMLNSGHCFKDKKVMDAHGFEFPLSSDSHEASKPETKTDSCIMPDTNGPKLSSSPMQLDIATGTSMDAEHVSDSKVDPAAGFLGARDVGNARGTNHNSYASEQLGVLNKNSISMTRDPEIYDTPMLNVKQTESMSKDVLPKADKKNEPLKSKQVRRPYLQGKLIKTSGSVNYRRLLPFLKNLTQEDSGTSKFGDQTEDAGLYAKDLPLPSQSEEASTNMQIAVSGPMQDKVDSNALANNIFVKPANMLTHGSLPESASSRNFSELPMQLDAKEMVHECLSEFYVQAHSEKAAISSKDECLSESKTDPCSVTMDFNYAKIVTDAANLDGFNQVHTTISEQHFSESPPKDQNLLNIIDISNHSVKHHSSKEQGFTIGYDRSNELVNPEKWESFSSCPPEGQSLGQLDPYVLDVEENETSSHAISRNDDNVVLSCVSISKEEPRPSSEKIISDKPELPDIAEENETNSGSIRKFDDSVVLSRANISNEEPRSPSEKIISDKPELPNIAAHGGVTAGSLLNDLVYASKMPSKGSNNKNASSVGEIENGSESKTALVLNRSPRSKLFKHAGSLNYKRLLPIFLETVKSNSCASNNDQHPKIQKLLDHTPVVPISDSNLLGNLKSASNNCVPVDDSTDDSGAQKITELQACDLNNDSSSSSPRSRLPDEQIVSIGLDKLEYLISSPISVDRDLLSTPLRPITDEVISREEKATPTLSIVERSPETLGYCESSSQLKVTDQLSTPTVGFQKGILRRNPRGCRGLCTCLNCVSFRLHAERAFEFSRNQLLDADEVAQDLMKELSHLRNILERNNGVNDTPVFDGSQVKEACRKAFETEQMAKDRLCQMAKDLNMHCRTPSLQPPSVKFSDHVEEKVIQPDS